MSNTSSLIHLAPHAARAEGGLSSLRLRLGLGEGIDQHEETAFHLALIARVLVRVTGVAH